MKRNLNGKIIIMKIKKFLSVLSFILVFTSMCLSAQEEHTTHDTHHFQHHRIAVFTGYGFISGAVDGDGNKQLELIPVLGFDYEYFFNHKIGVGLFNDLELSSYSVQKEDDEYLQREYAFVSAMVFLYEPIIGLTLFAGPGYEFEKHHGFPLFKIGAEVAKHFQDGWSVGIAASFDLKEVNSAFSLGLTVVKGLGKK